MPSAHGEQECKRSGDLLVASTVYGGGAGRWVPPLLCRGPGRLHSLTGLRGHGQYGAVGTGRSTEGGLGRAAVSVLRRLGFCQSGAQDKGCSVSWKDVQSTKLQLPKARDLAESKARERVPDVLVDLDGGGGEMRKFYQVLFRLRSYLVLRTARCRADH